MLIQNNVIEEKSMGFDDTTTFSIDQAHLSKIFNLLSTSVYSNIPYSVTRELSSNMRDAMVEANKNEEPIFVTYNKETKLLSFKDEGIGMSPELVTQIYTKLGSTTKSSNASLIGGMGIGRMSVFAYCDYFYLDTIKEKIRYSYIVSKNSQGLPQIDLINEEETSESNGTTVSFDLQDKDYSKFKDAVIYQLKYFFNLIVEGFDLNNDFKIIKGKHFIWRTDANNINGLEICWGEVYYAIPWTQIGVPFIGLDCALFFPIETPFRPTAAREALEITEESIKLIVDKINDVKQELYDLWKEQQIIESFFKWREMTYKDIDIDGYKLNVTSVVDAPYIYKPLIGTNINPTKFKEHNSVIFDALFFYRKNIRWYSNGWDQIGKNDHIFHGNGNVSNHRLSNIGWRALVMKRESVHLNYRSVRYFYDKDSVQIDTATSNIIEPDFDLVAEIESIQNAIWDEITSKTVDAHSVDINRGERSKRIIGGTEVRGKFSDSSWEVRTLDSIRKYVHVVFTNDEEEFKILKGLRISARNKKTGMDKANFYLPIMCTKKYNDRLQEFMTYKQFLDSDVLKKTYYNSYKKNRAIVMPNLQKWYELHPMYKYKYAIQPLKVKSGYDWIPNSIYSYLENKYSTDHIDKEIERIMKAINNVKVVNLSGSALKYKLLYDFSKKKLNKVLSLQEKIETNENKTNG